MKTTIKRSGDRYRLVLGTAYEREIALQYGRTVHFDGKEYYIEYHFREGAEQDLARLRQKLNHERAFLNRTRK